MNVVRKFLQKSALWILLLPVSLGFLGAASNQLVLNVNHDTFPVSVNLVKAKEFAPDAVVMDDGTVMLDDIHCIASPKTHLNLLADVFDFHDTIKSIGDLLQDLGGWLWTFAPFVWGFAVISKLSKE